MCERLFHHNSIISLLIEYPNHGIYSSWTTTTMTHSQHKTSSNLLRPIIKSSPFCIEATKMGIWVVSKARFDPVCTASAGHSSPDKRSRVGAAFIVIPSTVWLNGPPWEAITHTSHHLSSDVGLGRGPWFMALNGVEWRAGIRGENVNSRKNNILLRTAFWTWVVFSSSLDQSLSVLLKTGPLGHMKILIGLMSNPVFKWQQHRSTPFLACSKT